MALKPMKIAVLMGGTSFEREFSLNSGRNVTRTLEAAGHTVLPLDTTKTLVETLRDQKPDAVYIALHGKNGEDGTIQALLEFLGIPFVGSSASVCRQAWNKALLPHIVATQQAAYQACGGETFAAHWLSRINLSEVTLREMGAATALDLVAERIEGGYPVAVKPTRGGSAMGVNKVDSVGGLADALLDALSFDAEALIEPWVTGTEIAVCVVGTGVDARILPPVEIAALQGFFDVEHRLDANLVEYYSPVRPASLAKTENEAQAALAAIEAAALEVHRAYQCRDLSRVDMIWDGTKPIVLEINVSPGMSESSLFPIACEAANLTLDSLFEELLANALGH
ncbi:MAG: D-alanine--D-alanine ligase [Coriobacteriales bacterium]|jgi:D-alanine-D-alanine ligase|nr:D-alanine--D-alanine ligase [Coriobacteriales bacterium]